MSALEKRSDASALGTLQREGFDFVEFWCVGGACKHRRSVPIACAIEHYGGPAMSLLMLARMAKCSCGRKGAHVQATRRVGYV